jgi:hypothetical protein
MVQASELMSRMPGPSNAVRPVAFRGGLRRVWPGVSDVTDPSRHGRRAGTPESGSPGNVWTRDRQWPVLAHRGRQARFLVAGRGGMASRAAAALGGPKNQFYG